MLYVGCLMIQAAERCFSFISKILFFSDISHHITYRSRERSGVMVECWTLNKEVLGSIPTGLTVLCP